MKRSCLSILIALVLFLSGVRKSAAFDQGGDQRHPTRPYKQEPTTQNQQTISPVFVAAIIGELRAIVSEDVAQQKQEHADHEDWNTKPFWLMFWLNFALVAVGTAYTIVAYRQWAAIREALATDKRAFMYADGFMQFWEHDPTTGLYNWRFRPRWRNAGETPTKDATMYVQCEIRDRPLPSGYDFPIDETAISRVFIGPKADMFGGVVPRGGAATAITPDDISDVQEGRKVIHMWGWIKYKDIFPNTWQHISHFCWFLAITGNPRTFIPQCRVRTSTRRTGSFQKGTTTISRN